MGALILLAVTAIAVSAVMPVLLAAGHVRQVLTADRVRIVTAAATRPEQAPPRPSPAPRAAAVMTPRPTASAAVAVAASAARPPRRASVRGRTPQQIAQAMLSKFGWSGSQFSCLEPLWARESGWSVTAYNPGSGAYGIPQALPGSKMASAGRDWQSSAWTQVKWGLGYIRAQYGSPCGAWDHEEADGWY